jgi:serine-type D-Ala-D-Ala carboxypeptidase (penicillin-binding protein 5/6)
LTTLREQDDKDGRGGPPPRAGARRAAAVAVAALLAAVPLTGPPTLARAGTGLPAGARGHARPQRTTPGAGAAGRAGQAGAGEDSPVIGGPGLAGRGIIVRYPPRAARRLPSVRASAYVIADAGTGQVLAAKDPHGHFLPASTLKVLTADALMPVLRPDAMVVASAMAADVTPNKVGLVQGHAYPVSSLFRALLLISANDAAIALAQATGSYGRGVALMNAEAHRLRADDTVAVRPNGLNATGQRSSAYDLALFARQALTLRGFMRIEAARVAMFPLHRRHPVELFNQNTMLGTYRGDLGGKIGWTARSETTFIAWARRDGHTLIVTLMHCVPLTEMTYAAKLLNWGFAMDGRVAPVGTLARPLPAAAAAHAGTNGAARGGPAVAGAAARRAGHLLQPAGFPLTAEIGALALAALTAGGILVLLRRRAGRGTPPGP